LDRPTLWLYTILHQGHPKSHIREPTMRIHCPWWLD